MKKYLILVISFILITYAGFTQVQATIKLGSKLNSVYITIRPTTTLTAAKLSSFQFAVGIPASVTPVLTATVVALIQPMIFDAPLISTETQNAVSYTVYSFNGDGAQTGLGTTYTAGQEYNYAEVFFTGGTLTISDVRIMQVPNGGSNFQSNLYIANMGNDVTDVAAQFYSTLPVDFSNDGNGYAGSSWAQVGPIVLPVKFIGFNVIKKNTDALLTWQIENESALTDHYEIERSLNGVDFKKAYTVLPKYNGNSSNSYELADMNLSSIRSAGIFYYRVKQVDKDAHFIYTGIKNLRLNVKGIVIGVYPNPVRNTANVTIDLEQDANTIITLHDASGKQVQLIQLPLFKGMNSKKVNLGALAAGSYMLKVQTATEIKTIPVVKTN